MTDCKDGGPAFPVPIAVGPAGDEYHSELHGMTLRDYFAGQVLAGLHADETLGNNAKAMSLYAYAVAGAMLKERER